MQNEKILNKISDYLIHRSLTNIDEKIDELFNQIQQKIFKIIEEAKSKYKEKLGNNSEIIESI